MTQQKDTCPICHDEIVVAKGQRVYTCGKKGCRKRRKQLNKAYVKRTGYNPETSKIKEAKETINQAS